MKLAILIEGTKIRSATGFGNSLSLSKIRPGKAEPDYSMSTIQESYCISEPFYSMSHPLARRIAIIGAGSSGLAQLKQLLDAFSRPGVESRLEVVVFESRSEIGGVWSV
jgi:hypothetical protein